MKKLHEWDLWDWKSIWWTILLLGGFFVVGFYLFNRGHYQLKFSQKDMTGLAVGEIYQKSTNENIVQGVTGNRQSIDGITVYFSYIVDGKKYRHYQTLTYSIIDAPRLNQIYSALLPVKIKVKYNTDNPYLSAIDLE